MISIKNILILTGAITIFMGIGYVVKPNINEYLNKRGDIEEKESEE